MQIDSFMRIKALSGPSLEPDPMKPLNAFDFDAATNRYLDFQKGKKGLFANLAQHVSLLDVDDCVGDVQPIEPDVPAEQNADSDATDVDEMPFWSDDELDDAGKAAAKELQEGTDRQITANAPAAGFADEAASWLNDLNILEFLAGKISSPRMFSRGSKIVD